MWIVEGGPHFAGRTSGSDEPLSTETNPRRVELAGAINETLSFRFALSARSTSVERPKLRITPFAGAAARIDRFPLQVFRMHRVSVERLPGWHIRSIPPAQRDPAPLDVLVPISAPEGGMPGSLVPGEVYDFWVDVPITRGTFAETYSGKIELISGRATLGAVDVQLTVWPFILPGESDVPIIAEFDHRKLLRHHAYRRGRQFAVPVEDWRDSPMRSELDALLGSAVRVLQGHGLTPVLHRLAPLVKVDAYGDVVIDWEFYDAVAGPFVDGRAFANRVPSRHWPMPVHAIASLIRNRDTLSSPGYAALLRRYLAQCAAHFQSKGWLERSYAMAESSAFLTSHRDSPGMKRREMYRAMVDAASARRARDFSTVAGSADERISIVSRLWPQDLAPYGWNDYLFADFSEAVDIWLPPAQFYDARVMADQRAAGRRTWMAVDRPPYSGSISISAPAAHVRVLAWQAGQLGAQALYLGCVNRWPDPAEPSTPEDCVRFDPNVLLYPGGPFGLDEPVVSVRLKHLRRASQDAAYRRLLSARGLDHLSATLGRSLAPYAGSDAYRTHFADGRPIGWVDDPAVFDLAKDIMAEALMNALDGSRRNVGTETFTRGARWRRFILATRRLHIFVDGTRVRLRGTRTAWEADVECALTIANRRRVPVSGTVRFTDLPQGWTAAATGRPTGSIAPNSSRRVTLTARATVFPIGPAGFLTLPIEFAGEEGQVYRCNVRVSFIAAVPLEADRVGSGGTIRVDGDLSDWPPGATNVASDFLLITGGGTERDDDPETRPQNATLVFVMRDTKYLYIAINCKSDARAVRRVSRRNRVDYDDLIPLGDELVELLIDPLNTGTRSPADLYHMVVKPSGTYFLEKGIAFEPPCGPREPWPADIDVATGLAADRWTAELRIPLDAFNLGATEHTIWGLNVTRYDASRQEFSTWSGASGNAYDPISLGNLYLP